MSFLTAVSGLNAAQADISTTSNNIANVGTIGFHGSRTEFGDIYTNSPYSNPETQIGSGALLTRVTKSFSQGNVAATSNTLDLAIQGQGFLKMQTELNGGEPVYTRNGALGLNRDGYVVDASNHYLHVFPTSEQGDTLTLSQTGPLRVETSHGTPAATSLADVSVNMSTLATGQGNQAAVPPATFDPEDNTTYAQSTPINVFDADGRPREAMLYFAQIQSPTADDPNTSYSVHLVLDGVELPAEDSAAATLTFDENGEQTSGDTPFTFSSPIDQLSVNLEGSTLTDRNFGVKAMTHDGTTTRSLSALEVDDTGVVWASYGDEAPIALGKIALASFANAQGLKNLGSASYTQTRSSGEITLGEPGINGFGSLRSGALEQANVDLTNELVNLITAQRNYQASAKALETSSALSQAIMNIRG